MGVSTNAVMFYGYCWDEEKELLAGEWEEHVLRSRGHVNPWDAYNATGIDAIRDYRERDRKGKEWCDVHRAELDQWYDLKKAVKAELGCDIGRHCSGSCPMPYVFIGSSEKTVYRGRPWAFDPVELVTEDQWSARLDAFLAATGIEKPEGQERPQWWLVSYWD